MNRARTSTPRSRRTRSAHCILHRAVALADQLEARTLLSTWQMSGRDIWNTNRADFAIPESRLDNSLLDIFAWQTPAPDSPNDGNVGGTTMTFFDGAAPGGADLVVGTYHWPKGIQGMDRHTGAVFWYGNPDGGESIGEEAPAFSSDGTTIYVTNDATAHPLMAFASDSGPSAYRDNGADPQAQEVVAGSAKIAPDGRIVLHSYDNRPNAWSDSGSSLSFAWDADNSLFSIFTNPALYDTGSQLLVISSGRAGQISAFDGLSGATVWTQSYGIGTDANPTVDPATGNVYVPVSNGDLFLVGVDSAGNNLWPALATPVFDDPSDGQRVCSAGALSFDGTTYYFQSSSDAGTGNLFAINTADGSVKWTCDTHSQSGEGVMSSPIVTPNGVIIVGNNDGGTYFALRDDGTQATLIDSLQCAPGGRAAATATLADDGMLYLPLRVTQTTGNADNPSPSFAVENLFTAVDLSEGATPSLPAPAGQRAFAQDHAVQVAWRPVVGLDSAFDHYAVYRSTSPFGDVGGMIPITTIGDVAASQYTDNTAENGISYFYAVTAVSTGGGEVTGVPSVGPRTPWQETDLQVVSIARSPEYPRYAPTYTNYTISEPSGYGPYSFSAATGLGNGQDADTQRFSDVNDPVTYTATIRNRGTTGYAATVDATWTLDGAVVATPSQVVSLAPGDEATFTYVIPWDNLPHDLSFTLDIADARPANNTLASNTLAVPFLTYIDKTFIENFREVWSLQWPDIQTDDVIDWLNMHMDRFNALFAAAGTDKRVHYGVLQVLDDIDPDPATDTSPYAIFPYRYRASDGDPRLSGYYHTDDDIDYGLLHEMGHQLGLIDLYQLDVPAEANLVSGRPYSAVTGLMHGVSPVISEHSALAMEHWLHTAHGYFGQYLYDIPQTMRLQLLGRDGQPLAGATVQMFQLADRPGAGKVISDQVKAQGTTDAGGYFTLPNVPVDPALVPTTFAGDTLHDNPFGYLAVIGSNGVLHFKVQYQGSTDYAWLDVTDANLAYWHGDTDLATFTRQLTLGGPVQMRPPVDIAENNAGDFSAYAQGASASVFVDTTRTIAGGSSIRFVTDGGFDTAVQYPATYSAHWDLTSATTLTFSIYAEDPSPYGFQAGPVVRLSDGDGNYFQYEYYSDGNPSTPLNNALGQWVTFQVPLNAPDNTTNGWRRTASGPVSLSDIGSLEIHADTWDYGFTLWLDGVGFDLPMPAGDISFIGTTQPDTYVIRPNGDNLDIFENLPSTGAPNYRIPIAQITSLSIDGGTGAARDTITVDLSGGGSLPDIPIALAPSITVGDELILLGRPGLVLQLSIVSGTRDRGTADTGAGTLDFYAAAVRAIGFDAITYTGSSNIEYLTLAQDATPGFERLSGVSGFAGVSELAFEQDTPLTLDLVSGQDQLQINSGSALLALINPELALAASGGITRLFSTTRLASLSLTGDARLDVQSSDLILDGALLSVVRPWLSNGLTGAAPALLTSTPGHAVGLAENALLHLASWNGEPLGGGYDQLILHPTLSGDTNLDGAVTQADYVNLIANIGKTDACWFLGDLNSDGLVSIDDFAIVTAGLASMPLAPVLLLAEPPASAPATTASVVRYQADQSAVQAGSTAAWPPTDASLDQTIPAQRANAWPQTLAPARMLIGLVPPPNRIPSIFSVPDPVALSIEW